MDAAITTTTTETEAHDPEVTPENSRLAGVPGVLATLGDGRDWVLASAMLDPAEDAIRDYLFDVAAAYGEYDLDEDLMKIAILAVRLLLRAHAITPSHAMDLVRIAEPDALVKGVMAALFGASNQPLTYSVWARVSLRANGIDPERIAAAEVRPTLDALQAQGKTLDKSLVPSVRMGEKRRSRL